MQSFENSAKKNVGWGQKSVLDMIHNYEGKKCGGGVMAGIKDRKNVGVGEGGQKNIRLHPLYNIKWNSPNEALTRLFWPVGPSLPKVGRPAFFARTSN